MVNNILNIAGLLILILLVNKAVMPRIIKWTDKLYMMKRIDSGIIRKNDFYSMPSKVRHQLLGMYVKSLGFTRFSSDDVFGKDIDYTCITGKEPAYVKTFFQTISGDSDGSDVFKVGRPDIQKFLGQMAHDNVCRGVVITNGQFSGDAVEFAEALSEGHKINLINGDELFNYFNSYIIN